MQFGYFMMPSHPPERGLKEGHDWDLQVLRWLDELGYSEAWVGEHHTAPWEPHPAPDLLIAQSLKETTRLRMAPAVSCCPTTTPPSWRTGWRCSTTSRTAG
jgi:alkanesulfonate monooxygenase SsuD/methylene tetrahydromethanopterin reductase-like flavin-dependent oxidoreductase (luciferase family)